MIRIMWLLRRKPGISFEQFRDHYETSHAALGAKYLGHLLLAYRRNYILPAEAAGGSDVMRKALAAKAWDYDCITEWDLADEAAFDMVVATRPIRRSASCSTTTRSISSTGRRCA